MSLHSALKQLRRHFVSWDVRSIDLAGRTEWTTPAGVRNGQRLSQLRLFPRWAGEPFDVLGIELRRRLLQFYSDRSSRLQPHRLYSGSSASAFSADGVEVSETPVQIAVNAPLKLLFPHLNRQGCPFRRKATDVRVQTARGVPLCRDPSCGCGHILLKLDFEMPLTLVGLAALSIVSAFWLRIQGFIMMMLVFLPALVFVLSNEFAPFGRVAAYILLAFFVMQVGYFAGILLRLLLQYVTKQTSK